VAAQALASVAAAQSMSAVALGRLAPGGDRRRYHDDITVTVVVLAAAAAAFP
jgi:hypothetical protein